MRVLVIIGRYPPDHSGAGLRIMRSYDYMARRYGLSYTVLAEPVRMAGAPADLPRVRRLSSGQPAPLLALRILSSMLAPGQKPDLVHCIGPTRMTVLGAFLARLLRIPCVTETSLDYDDRAKTGNPVNRMLLRAFYRPRGAVALSPRIADIYKKYGMQDRDIFLRPNPVSLDKAKELSAVDGALLGRVDEMPVTYRHLVLGRYGQRKNQSEAVGIIAALPPEHGLILAGPVLEDEGYVDALKRQVADLNLQRRVLIWEHAVDNPARLYPKIDALWCPSLSEGLPNVVLETLWSGRPCFVNRGLGLGEWIIQTGNGAEFTLNDPASAAALIQAFMERGYDSGAIARDIQVRCAPERINDQTYAFLQRIKDERTWKN